MFHRIRKALFRGGGATPGEPSRAGSAAEWAAGRGLGFAQSVSGGTTTLHGKVQGRPWRIEIGRPTRDYIEGEELRARAELRVDDDVAAWARHNR